MTQPFAERDRLIAAAQAAASAGDFAGARTLAAQALAHDPESIAAKNLCAILSARLGDAGTAIRLLTEILEKQPDSFEALISLATLYRDAGDIDRAAEAGFRAVRLRPNAAQAHFEFGLTWLTGRQPDRAVVALTRASQIQPDFAPTFAVLGKAWRGLENHQEAARAYRRAAELAPSHEVFLGLARSLNKLSEFEGAAEAAGRAVGLHNESSAAHLALAGALYGLERPQEAHAELSLAIALDHEGTEAFSIGLVQRVAGDLEGSNRSFRRAIQHDPLLAPPYALLVHNSRVAEDDRPLVEKMRTLVEMPHVSLVDKGGLHYGLGKALEDLGELGEAMREYDEANRIARKTKLNDAPIDMAEIRQRTDTMIRLVTPSAVQGGNVGRDDSDLPVLIVGMMRSGTTLAEQILSSHPQVSAAGEHPFWMKNWTRALAAGGSGLDGAKLAALGREYVGALRAMWPDAKRITDKMPSNFLVSGLVHLALPNARIIHLRRNPCDNALSIWTTPNTPVSDGGHDKACLVAVFREYFRLMEHLRAILPADRFLEIDYEGLVSDQEAVTRKMVAFCGLEWDDACLQPERNPRPVLTPSVWQVRQPVYTSSVGRWRRFEPWLGAFLSLLDTGPVAGGKLQVVETAHLLAQGRAAISAEDYSAAERILRSAAEQDPNDAGACELLGSVQKVLGQFDEASNAFESALRLNSSRVGLLYDLVTMRRLSAEDLPLIERLEQALHSGGGGGGAGDEELVRLHFGLGKAYEDLGRYAEAMTQFEAGHEVALVKLRQTRRLFDQRECEQRFDAIIQTYSKNRLRASRGGSGSDLPLLIVGMVRSGTTLVEQILSCHSEVAAAGELSFWPENWQRVKPKGQGFDESELMRVAGKYLGVLREFGSEARRVTDKMPGNYIALGAIHAVLPHAKVIVCRRNPLDTAISIFTTPIQSAHTWIHRREDIVFFFRQYERLMAHWRDVLPAETLFEAPYEHLAEEPLRATQGLLQYAGLPWEDGCLRPESKVRAVTTPSQWQVRQPIYRTSVERWRRYGPWLGELAELG